MGLLCRHEAERLKQEAKGRLEKQEIMDEAEAEKVIVHFILCKSPTVLLDSIQSSIINNITKF